MLLADVLEGAVDAAHSAGQSNSRPCWCMHRLPPLTPPAEWLTVWCPPAKLRGDPGVAAQLIRVDRGRAVHAGEDGALEAPGVNPLDRVTVGVAVASTSTTTGALLVPRPRLCGPVPGRGLPPTYVSSTSTVPFSIPDQAAQPAGPQSAFQRPSHGYLCRDWAVLRNRSKPDRLNRQPQSASSPVSQRGLKSLTKRASIVGHWGDPERRTGAFPFSPAWMLCCFRYSFWGRIPNWSSRSSGPSSLF